MFETTQLRRTRDRAEVTIRLANGDSIDGFLFVAQKERVSDLLNDERAFLPVEAGDETIVVAKTQIAEVRIHEVITENDETNPYETLRVEPEASDAELRAAWMKRVKACHPDRLAALNLDPEIIQSARRVSQRINSAYDKVIRERKAKRAA